MKMQNVIRIESIIDVLCDKSRTITGLVINDITNDFTHENALHVCFARSSHSNNHIVHWDTNIFTTRQKLDANDQNCRGESVSSLPDFRVLRRGLVLRLASQSFGLSTRPVITIDRTTKIHMSHSRSLPTLMLACYLALFVQVLLMDTIVYVFVGEFVFSYVGHFICVCFPQHGQEQYIPSAM